MILIAEDDQDIRTVLIEMLEGLGHTTIAFADAESAVQFLNSGGIDDISIIASDFILPGANGLELIKYARNLRSNIPCFIISGYATQNIPSGVHYLKKPFQLRQLKEIVTKCRQQLTESSLTY